MQRLVVTLVYQQKNMDVDIPMNLPFIKMLTIFANVLEIEQKITELHEVEQPEMPLWLDFQVEYPVKVKIHPHQSPLEVGILDGARIRVHKVPAPFYFLHATGEGGEQNTWYVYRERAVLGRRPRGDYNHQENEIFIDVTDIDKNRTTSRPHAIIEKQNDQWMLIPLPKTTNPTQFEGKVIEQPVPLPDGASFALGSVQFTFHMVRK